MFLLLDPSTKDAFRLVLFTDTGVVHEQIFSRSNRDFLFCIDSFLSEKEIEKTMLRGIAVVVGTGGFTSTRIAVTIANVFGYTLKIPLLAVSSEQSVNPQTRIPLVLGQPVGQYISATYSGEPNIGRKA